MGARQQGRVREEPGVRAAQRTGRRPGRRQGRQGRPGRVDLHSRRQHRHGGADERRSRHDRADHAGLPAGAGKQPGHQAEHLGGHAGHGHRQRAASAVRQAAGAPGAVLPGEPEGNAVGHRLPREVPGRLLRHAVHLWLAAGQRRGRGALRQARPGARQAAVAGGRLQGREDRGALPHRPHQRARRHGADPEHEESRPQGRPADHGLGLAGGAPPEEGPARPGRLEPVPDLGRVLRCQHAGHQSMAVGRLRQQPARLALRQGTGRAAHAVDPGVRCGQAQGDRREAAGARLRVGAIRDVGRIQAGVGHPRADAHRADEDRHSGHVERRKNHDAARGRA
ncbi:hypothetical protein BN2905_44630 [Achromobacter xylosoxidans]|nr:hypothetical protein BN2905_44630 [Achromobacter xylosoxidans]